MTRTTKWLIAAAIPTGYHATYPSPWRNQKMTDYLLYDLDGYKTAVPLDQCGVCRRPDGIYNIWEIGNDDSSATCETFQVVSSFHAALSWLKSETSKPLEES